MNWARRALLGAGINSPRDRWDKKERDDTARIGRPGPNLPPRGPQGGRLPDTPDPPGTDKHNFWGNWRKRHGLPPTKGDRITNPVKGPLRNPPPTANQRAEDLVNAENAVKRITKNRMKAFPKSYRTPDVQTKGRYKHDVQNPPDDEHLDMKNWSDRDYEDEMEYYGDNEPTDVWPPFPGPEVPRDEDNAMGYFHNFDKDLEQKYKGYDDTGFRRRGRRTQDLEKGSQYERHRQKAHDISDQDLDINEVNANAVARHPEGRQHARDELDKLSIGIKMEHHAKQEHDTKLLDQLGPKRPNLPRRAPISKAALKKIKDMGSKPYEFAGPAGDPSETDAYKEKRKWASEALVARARGTLRRQRGPDNFKRFELSRERADTITDIQRGETPANSTSTMKYDPETGGVNETVRLGVSFNPSEINPHGHDWSAIPADEHSRFNRYVAQRGVKLGLNRDNLIRRGIKEEDWAHNPRGRARINYPPYGVERGHQRSEARRIAHEHTLNHPPPHIVARRKRRAENSERQVRDARAPPRYRTLIQADLPYREDLEWRRKNAGENWALGAALSWQRARSIRQKRRHVDADSPWVQYQNNLDPYNGINEQKQKMWDKDEAERRMEILHPDYRPPAVDMVHPKDQNYLPHNPKPDAEDRSRSARAYPHHRNPRRRSNATELRRHKEDRMVNSWIRDRLSSDKQAEEEHTRQLQKERYEADMRQQQRASKWVAGKTQPPVPKTVKQMRKMGGPNKSADRRWRRKNAGENWALTAYRKPRPPTESETDEDSDNYTWEDVEEYPKNRRVHRRFNFYRDAEHPVVNLRDGEDVGVFGGRQYSPRYTRPHVVDHKRFRREKMWNWQRGQGYHHISPQGDAYDEFESDELVEPLILHWRDAENRRYKRDMRSYGRLVKHDKKNIPNLMQSVFDGSPYSGRKKPRVRHWYEGGKGASENWALAGAAISTADDRIRRSGMRVMDKMLKDKLPGHKVARPDASWGDDPLGPKSKIPNVFHHGRSVIKRFGENSDWNMPFPLPTEDKMGETHTHHHGDGLLPMRYYGQGGNLAMTTISPKQFQTKIDNPEWEFGLDLDEDDEHRVDVVRDKIEEGEYMDPVEVTLGSGGLGDISGIDGRHRAEAAAQLGIKKMPAYLINPHRTFDDKAMSDLGRRTDAVGRAKGSPKWWEFGIGTGSKTGTGKKAARRGAENWALAASGRWDKGTPHHERRIDDDTLQQAWRRLSEGEANMVYDPVTGIPRSDRDYDALQRGLHNYLRNIRGRRGRDRGRGVYDRRTQLADRYEWRATREKMAGRAPGTDPAARRDPDAWDDYADPETAPPGASSLSIPQKYVGLANRKKWAGEALAAAGGRWDGDPHHISVSDRRWYDNPAHGIEVAEAMHRLTRKEGMRAYHRDRDYYDKTAGGTRHIMSEHFDNEVDDLNRGLHNYARNVMGKKGPDYDPRVMKSDKRKYGRLKRKWASENWALQATSFRKMLAPGSKYWDKPNNEGANVYTPGARDQMIKKYKDEIYGTPQVQRRRQKMLRSEKHIKTQPADIKDNPVGPVARQKRHLQRRQLRRFQEADPGYELNNEVLDHDGMHQMYDAYKKATKNPADGTWTRQAYGLYSRKFGRRRADQVYSIRRAMRRYGKNRDELTPAEVMAHEMPSKHRTYKQLEIEEAEAHQRDIKDQERTRRRWGKNNFGPDTKWASEALAAATGTGGDPAFWEAAAAFGNFIDVTPPARGRRLSPGKARRRAEAGFRRMQKNVDESIGLHADPEMAQFWDQPEWSKNYGRLEQELGRDKMHEKASVRRFMRGVGKWNSTGEDFDKSDTRVPRRKWGGENWALAARYYGTNTNYRFIEDAPLGDRERQYWKSVAGRGPAPREAPRPTKRFNRIETGDVDGDHENVIARMARGQAPDKAIVHPGARDRRLLKRYSLQLKREIEDGAKVMENAESAKKFGDDVTITPAQDRHLQTLDNMMGWRGIKAVDFWATKDKFQWQNAKTNRAMRQYDPARAREQEHAWRRQYRDRYAHTFKRGNRNWTSGAKSATPTTEWAIQAAVDEFGLDDSVGGGAHKYRKSGNDIIRGILAKKHPGRKVNEVLYNSKGDDHRQALFHHGRDVLKKFDREGHKNYWNISFPSWLDDEDGKYKIHGPAEDDHKVDSLTRDGRAALTTITPKAFLGPHNYEGWTSGRHQRTFAAPGTYNRNIIDRLADRLKKGEPVDPPQLHVWQGDNKSRTGYRYDGAHRNYAAIEAGKDELPAYAMHWVDEPEMSDARKAEFGRRKNLLRRSPHAFDPRYGSENWALTAVSLKRMLAPTSRYWDTREKDPKVSPWAVHLDPAQADPSIPPRRDQAENLQWGVVADEVQRIMETPGTQEELQMKKQLRQRRNFSTAMPDPDREQRRKIRLQERYNPDLAKEPGIPKTDVQGDTSVGNKYYGMINRVIGIEPGGWGPDDYAESKRVWGRRLADHIAERGRKSRAMDHGIDPDDPEVSGYYNVPSSDSRYYAQRGGGKKKDGADFGAAAGIEPLTQVGLGPRIRRRPRRVSAGGTATGPSATGAPGRGWGGAGNAIRPPTALRRHPRAPL